MDLIGKAEQAYQSRNASWDDAAKGGAASGPKKFTQDLAKAYYRRALALIAQNNLDAAAQDLERALELAPEDAGIKRERAALADKRQKKLEAQRRQYAKMFG